MLFKYNDFINEAHLDMLLEGKMYFTKDFILTLGKINSNISKDILGLNQKDVDINTNYIDIEVGKDEFIKFIPNDKLEPKFKVVDSYEYVNISGFQAESLGIDRGNLADELTNGEIGTIVRKLTDAEAKSISSDGENKTYYIFKKDKNSEEIVVNYDAISPVMPDNIRKSDIKVGKFARRLLMQAGISYPDKEIEDFVNKFKSEMKIKNDAFSRFKIVNGDDIKKYYLVSSYKSESGSLGGSCMRHSKCEEYLNFYSENHDVCSLIILMDNDSDYITARALLWTDINGRKFMDRVYTNDHSDERLFKEYAIANGFYYKYAQDNLEDFMLMFNDKEVESNEIVVQMKRGYYDRYPYLDTLKSYNIHTGRLSNVSSSNDDLYLEETDGGNGCTKCNGFGHSECSYCSGSGRYECDNCDGSGSLDCDECNGGGEVGCHKCDTSGEVDCSNCDGSGKVDGDDDEENCPDCGGNGKETCDTCDGSGYNSCDECDGRGNIDCHDCDGNGRIDCDRCDGEGDFRCTRCRD